MANTTRRRKTAPISDDEARSEAEAKPTILTTVRMDQTDGGPPELFHPGQEDELEEYLTEVHGEGDEEKGLKSRDEVLVYLTRKGYIANFEVDDEVLENAQQLTIEQQLERRWKRQKREQEENGGEATEEQAAELNPRSVVPPARGRRAATTRAVKTAKTPSDDGEAGDPDAAE